MVAMGEEAKLTVLPQPQFPQWDVTVKISAVISRDCTSKSHVRWVLANVFSVLSGPMSSVVNTWCGSGELLYGR